MNDKQQIFERMGRELAALRDLIGRIGTDPEYLSVMTCAKWKKLGRAQTHIDELRSEAESRMARVIPGWTTGVFYPRDRRDLEEAIIEFRDKMKEAPQ